MDYFPMFVDLRGKRCLVIGGGEVAVRKAALLVRVGAIVDVVAPTLCTAMQELVAAHGLEHRAREYATADLEEIELVVAATDDAAVNAAVSRSAQQRRIPVNVVDQPALCSFIVPSFIDRSPLIIAISSAGGAPVLARSVRAKLEAQLPVRLGELAALFTRMRDEVKARMPSVAARRAFWEQALEGAVAEAALAGDLADAERLLRDSLAQGTAPLGTLTLIGTGPGDPELLCMRALRCMQRADLILHAPDVPEAILELSRRDAARESLQQPLADAAVGCMDRIAARVAAGQHVCVLAPDDSFRGVTGIRFADLAGRAGVHARVVPGVSQVE